MASGPDPRSIFLAVWKAVTCNALPAPPWLRDDRSDDHAYYDLRSVAPRTYSDGQLSRTSSVASMEVFDVGETVMYMDGRHPYPVSDAAQNGRKIHLDGRGRGRRISRDKGGAREAVAPRKGSTQERAAGGTVDLADLKAARAGAESSDAKIEALRLEVETLRAADEASKRKLATEIWKLREEHEQALVKTQAELAAERERLKALRAELAAAKA